VSLGIDLIILAAIAVFVISRLYAVLGQKNGTEQRPPSRQFREAPVRIPDADDAADAEARAKLRPAFTGPAAAGLEAIAAQDASFSPDDFTRGARKAYEMTVAAFADGDRETLRQLVDDDVFEVYSAAITEREKTASEPMRLVRLRQARIVEASVDAQNWARVLVSFESELTDGDNIRQAKEIWTFKRSFSSADPNWLLDEVATAT